MRRSFTITVPPMTLGLALNRHTVSVGDAVQAALSLANGGPSALRDFYFAMLVPPALSTSLGCPAGDGAMFLADAFTRVVTRCLGSAPPQTLPP